MSDVHIFQDQSGSYYAVPDAALHAYRVDDGKKPIVESLLTDNQAGTASIVGSQESRGKGPKEPGPKFEGPSALAGYQEKPDKPDKPPKEPGPKLEFRSSVSVPQVARAGLDLPR